MFWSLRKLRRHVHNRHGLITRLHAQVHLERLGSGWLGSGRCGRKTTRQSRAHRERSRTERSVLRVFDWRNDRLPVSDACLQATIGINERNSDKPDWLLQAIEKRSSDESDQKSQLSSVQIEFYDSSLASSDSSRRSPSNCRPSDSVPAIHDKLTGAKDFKDDVPEDSNIPTTRINFGSIDEVKEDQDAQPDIALTKVTFGLPESVDDPEDTTAPEPSKGVQEHKDDRDLPAQ